MMINNIHCNIFSQCNPTKGGTPLKNPSITEETMLRSCSTAGSEMIWTEKYSYLIKNEKYVFIVQIKPTNVVIIYFQFISFT